MSRFSKICTWIWIVSLLGATIGISVHQLYCYCVGETTYSIFHEAVDACSAQQPAQPAVDQCCHKEESLPACCARPDGREQHDCTQKTVKVFQLKTEFLGGQPLDKTFDCPIWADEFPDFVRLYRAVICDAEPSNKAPPAPPPPLRGRVICLRHEVFRC